MPFKVYQLGLMDYDEALDLQRKLWSLRKDNKISDVLLLLEHPPVFTIGRMGREDEILLSEAELKKRGIKVYKIERGGRVTYHGPGQLIGYPIFNLKEIKCSPIKFLRSLEETIILTLSEYGIKAHRINGKTGVWVKESKIASIGIYVSNWITLHGFAINVNTSLEYYKMIIPCGLQDCHFVNLSELIERKIHPFDIVPSLIKNFNDVTSAFYKQQITQ